MNNTLDEFVCNRPAKSNVNLIERLYLKENEDWSLVLIDSKILIVLDGDLRFSLGDFPSRVISKGRLLMIPSGYHFKTKALVNSEFVIIRMDAQLQFCDCFSFDNLSREKENNLGDDINYLDFNIALVKFIDSLTLYLDDKLTCSYLYQLKIKELFFIFRSYYDPKDLYAFFYMYLTNNNSFSDYIYKNYKKVKTVEEFAKLSNYSLSGFQKRFKKVFGMPVYQWMKEQRSRNILHEINNTKKSFKEISDDFGFYSPSHFNDFCKMQFGSTPGDIRKKKY